MIKFSNVKISQIDLSDDKVFEEVYMSFFLRLCAFAKQYLKDDIFAEEVVQDTFLHLWEKRNDLTINTSLKAYLFKSVLNTIYNYFKHKKVELKYSQWYKEYFHETQMNNTINEEPGLYDDIFNAVNKLPERCREIFIMNKIHRLKHKEIAEKLGIKPKTVEVQLRKAKIMLHDLLKKYAPIVVLFFYWLFE